MLRRAIHCLRRACSFLGSSTDRQSDFSRRLRASRNSSLGISAGQAGPANVLGNVEFFDNDRCLGPGVRLENSSLIFASSLGEASAICASLGSTFFVGNLAEAGWDAPPHAYGCDVIPCGC
jgi:hypothetical protein